MVAFMEVRVEDWVARSMKELSRVMVMSTS